MKRHAALLAAACLLAPPFICAAKSRTEGAVAAGNGPSLISRTVKTKLKGHEQLSLFLRPSTSGKTDGVLCLCLLAHAPEAIAELLEKGYIARTRISGDLDFADNHNLAVVAWSAQSVWDPTRNWDELTRAEAKRIDDNFTLLAKAWEDGIKYFVKNHGIPPSGYLIKGYSAAAQYAQRLALRCPERFLAVNAHIASSFDAPTKGGASVLWCVTTGENELGYGRSRRFFKVARDMGYPIIYKAYPGLAHEGNGRVVALGYKCFEFALEEYARATRLNGGKPTKPDWTDLFTSSMQLADIFNQAVYSKFDYFCVPQDFRMLLPSNDIKDAWMDE